MFLFPQLRAASLLSLRCPPPHSAHLRVPYLESSTGISSSFWRFAMDIAWGIRTWRARRDSIRRLIGTRYAVAMARQHTGRHTA